MRGIKIDKNKIKEYGIEDLWDDKWLPYVEGHRGVFLSILQDNTGTGDYIFVGWSRGLGDRNSGVDFVEINAPDKSEVAEELRKAGVQFDEKEIEDMLIGIWM